MQLDIGSVRNILLHYIQPLASSCDSGVDVVLAIDNQLDVEENCKVKRLQNS